MQQLEPGQDAQLFIGRTLESAALALFDGEDVLLIDSLGSRTDATALRSALAARGKRVRMVISTHFMGDHIAGLAVFKGALTMAHRHHRATFLSQGDRNDGDFVEPHLLMDGPLELRWGRHTLHVVPNPGKTMDHLLVDVPTLDLVCAGDNIVGNIVFLSKSDPALIDQAVQRIQRLGRKWVVSGHMGLLPALALANARAYLTGIRDRVVRIRQQHGPEEQRRCIAGIAIEDCIAPGVVPTAFEREWHGHNLRVIVEQDIFSLDAHLTTKVGESR